MMHFMLQRCWEETRRRHHDSSFVELSTIQTGASQLPSLQTIPAASIPQEAWAQSPSPPLSSSSFLSHVLPSPSLEVGPVKSSWGGVGERCKLPHFSLKIWHFVATILITYLRIKWPIFWMYMQRLNTQYTNWFLPHPFFGGRKLRPAWNPWTRQMCDVRRCAV